MYTGARNIAKLPGLVVLAPHDERHNCLDPDQIELTRADII